MFTKKIALVVLGSLDAGGIALADTGSSAQAPAPDQGGWRAKILQKYDTNGDGKLDDQERAAMRANFQAKRAAHRAKMLAEFDTNKDGKLEPTERAAMRKERADKVFARLDTNGDGQISRAEFEQGRAFGHHHRRDGGFGGSGESGGAPTDSQP